MCTGGYEAVWEIDDRVGYWLASSAAAVCSLVLAAWHYSCLLSGGGLETTAPGTLNGLVACSEGATGLSGAVEAHEIWLSASVH